MILQIKLPKVSTVILNLGFLLVFSLVLSSPILPYSIYSCFLLVLKYCLFRKYPRQIFQRQVLLFQWWDKVVSSLRQSHKWVYRYLMTILQNQRVHYGPEWLSVSPMSTGCIWSGNKDIAVLCISLFSPMLSLLFYPLPFSVVYLFLLNIFSKISLLF